MSIFLGGTGSANELDDYEEGSFSPQVNSGFTVTYGSQFGRYTKIGNRVIFSLYIGTNGISGSASGNAVIRGLPFTASSFSGMNGYDISVSWIYVLGETVTKGYVNQNTDYIQLLKAPTSGSRNHASANGTWDKANMYISCSGSYMTNF